MKRKKPEPKPRFPRVREEFAGELTPGIWPGPITVQALREQGKLK